MDNSKTIKEEYVKVANDLGFESQEAIADWWINKINLLRSKQLEVSKGMYWEGYDAGVAKQISQEHLSPAEANDLYDSAKSIINQVE